MIPDKKVAKFLLYAKNKNEIYYELGKRNIYVCNAKFLKPTKSPKTEHGIYMVKAVTDEPERISEFISKTDLKVIRIFKTALIRNKSKLPKGFLYSTSKNFCGMFGGNKENNTEGKTIRIYSKSTGLRDAFYKYMNEVTKEYNFNCRFDYDNYDLTFAVKKIKTNDDKTYLFTYFYNKEYPNVNNN